MPRDSSRLLIVNRKEHTIEEGSFGDIVAFLHKGDVLVLNDTRVMRAKLLGKKKSGAVIDVLLLKEKDKNTWEALVKPGKRARIGETILFEDNGLAASVVDTTPQGGRLLRFSSSDVPAHLERLGKAPLPPYIKKDIDDADKYQTVYARKQGAVAAPTAGLHFTPGLLDEIEKKGILTVRITLHCGLATFRPVKTDDIRKHIIEPEWIEVSSETAKIVNQAKRAGSRIVVVGTTSIRTLESLSCVDEHGVALLSPFSGETRLYIVPGYSFKMVDSVITNFHTPRSTNLILIASFCGQDLLKKVYQYAIKQNFRFFSFGDAMLIV